MKMTPEMLFVLWAMATVAIGGETPIKSLKLTGAMNAGGYAITNLAPGLLPSSPATVAQVNETNVADTAAVKAWAAGVVDDAVTAESVARAAGDTAGSNHVTAALASFAATGAVANAGTAATAGTAASAARLAGSDSWQTVEHGTATVWRVSDDTTRVYIVSASADFNGLAVGSVFDLTEVPLYFEHTPRPDVYVEWYNEWLLNDMDAENPLFWSASPAPAELPATLDNGSLNALGFCVIDYVPVTNSYPLAITDDIAAHNTDGSAHADIRAAIDAIPLPPTNAVAGWLVWDSGSNCYWRVSATNLRFYVWGTE